MTYNYEFLEDFDKALECYDNGLGIDDKDVELYNNREWVLSKMEMYDESIKSYEKAILLKPDEKRYYKNRTIVFKNLGDMDKAHDFYDKAYNLDISIESFEEIRN